MGNFQKIWAINDSRKPLELRISQDNQIRPESKEYTQEDTGSLKKIVMSGGVLYLPKRALIEIDSVGYVSGVTGAIGCILSETGINLALIHNEPTWLAFRKYDVLSLNNRYITNSSELEEYEKIINYYELWDDYAKNFMSHSSNPVVHINMFEIRATFPSVSLKDVLLRDVCEYGRALVFHTAGELILADKALELEANPEVEFGDEKIGEQIYMNLGNSIAKENSFQAKKYFRRWQDYLSYRDTLKETPEEEKRIAEIKDYFTQEIFYGRRKKIKTPKTYKLSEKKVRTPSFTDVFPQSKFY